MTRDELVEELQQKLRWGDAVVHLRSSTAREILAVLTAQHSETQISEVMVEAWRAIESAPKDGTAVLIWNDATNQISIAEWRPEDEHWVNVGLNGAVRKPTYWMPIPSPPGEK